jgi:hypothetical protein
MNTKIHKESRVAQVASVGMGVAIAAGLVAGLVESIPALAIATFIGGLATGAKVAQLHKHGGGGDMGQPAQFIPDRSNLASPILSVKDREPVTT